MVFILNFPPPIPGKLSKWPNIDNLIKTKLIMFMCEPHIVNRINLFRYNFHHSDEFLTKWLTMISLSKYWTMYQVRKWSNMARLSKAKLNNSISRPHFIKTMNLVRWILIIVMNFLHNDEFSWKWWIFIRIKTFYHNGDTMKNSSLQSSILIKVVDFHHNDEFKTIINFHHNGKFSKCFILIRILIFHFNDHFS